MKSFRCIAAEEDNAGEGCTDITVTINRPKAMNALNMDVLTELYDAFTKIETDKDVRIMPRPTSG